MINKLSKFHLISITYLLINGLLSLNQLTNNIFFELLILFNNLDLDPLLIQL